MRSAGRVTRYAGHNGGQSLVEFALLLPLFVLVIIGIFDLGRAFFAYIAITNAAREGVRVYTFDRKNAEIEDIYSAIDIEIGANTVVNRDNFDPYFPIVECALDPITLIMVPVDTTLELSQCVSEAPIQVTITYVHPLILSFFYPDGLTLNRSAQMMVP